MLLKLSFRLDGINIDNKESSLHPPLHLIFILSLLTEIPLINFPFVLASTADGACSLKKKTGD